MALECLFNVPIAGCHNTFFAIFTCFGKHLPKWLCKVYALPKTDMYVIPLNKIHNFSVIWCVKTPRKSCLCSP